MPINHSADIEHLLETGYEVEISRYFREGWETLKAHFGLFIVFTLIYLIITGLASRIPIVGPLASLVVSPPLIAGFYIVAFRIRDQQEVQLSNFFDGFKTVLTPLIVASLISAILTVIGFVLLVIPGIYLAVAYALVVPFIIGRQLDFWPALETSRQVVTKQWFGFLLLVICMILLNIVGVIALGVGFLISFPWTLCISAAAFDNIVGRSNGTADSP
jgi:hypothetical protein